MDDSSRRVDHRGLIRRSNGTPQRILLMQSREQERIRAAISGGRGECRARGASGSECWIPSCGAHRGYRAKCRSPITNPKYSPTIAKRTGETTSPRNPSPYLASASSTAPSPDWTKLPNPQWSPPVPPPTSPPGPAASSSSSAGVV